MLTLWPIWQSDSEYLIDLVATENQRKHQSSRTCLEAAICALKFVIKSEQIYCSRFFHPASVCIFFVDRNSLKFHLDSWLIILPFYEVRWLIFISIVCLMALFKTFLESGMWTEKPFVFFLYLWKKKHLWGRVFIIANKIEQKHIFCVVEKSLLFHKLTSLLNTLELIPRSLFPCLPPTTDFNYDRNADYYAIKKSFIIIALIIQKCVVSMLSPECSLIYSCHAFTWVVWDTL